MRYLPPNVVDFRESVTDRPTKNSKRIPWSDKNVGAIFGTTYTCAENVAERKRPQSYNDAVGIGGLDAVQQTINKLVMT